MALWVVLYVALLLVIAAVKRAIRWMSNSPQN